MKINLAFTLVVVALAAIGFCTRAQAFSYCGVAPPAPPGMYPVCMCDNAGNCAWVYVSSRK